jgi:DNA polymerase-3 subunit gamma/tau
VLGLPYLFAGPKGTGKTPARVCWQKGQLPGGFARKTSLQPLRELPCGHEGRFLDLIEIDAASNTSVDDVRELRDKINFAPPGSLQGYIIDEVHMLSTSAFNPS